MPTGVTGAFFGLPAATLNTLLANYVAALTGISTAGQSYTLAGRQFTRANIAEVRQTIIEITRALDRINGTSTTFTFANMNTGNDSGSGASLGPPTG